MIAVYRFLIPVWLAVVFIGSAARSQTVIKADGPWFSFREQNHDFGSVPADTTLLHAFEFSNTGNAPLIITDISLSCPCFEADWTRGPVMPGGTGTVTVRYPTTAKEGGFNKLLWITSNAANNTKNLDKYELGIRGDVRRHARAKKIPARRSRASGLKNK